MIFQLHEDFSLPKMGSSVGVDVCDPLQFFVCSCLP